MAQCVLLAHRQLQGRATDAVLAIIKGSFSDTFDLIQTTVT